ncbi:MAG: LysM peptidoglycan-binding domain-containing protein [Deltaproteobacteria bacterium]|nr:LysM peptidoglycan-binding domain-containing protein [Deltaproteobacteria bacterium]
MPWDEDERMSRIRIEPDQKEIPKDSDPLFSKKETSRTRWFKIPEEMPIGMIAVVILALVVLFILFIPRDKKAETEKMLASFEGRLTHLAERVGHLEEMGKGTVSKDVLDQSVEQLKGRMDRIETSLSAVTKHIEEKLAELKTSAPKKTPRKEAVKRKTPAAEAETGTHYIVQPGDTLYSISRKFDIPLDSLKALNKLSGIEIYPGQKLQVRRR